MMDLQLANVGKARDAYVRGETKESPTILDHFFKVSLHLCCIHSNAHVFNFSLCTAQATSVGSFAKWIICNHLLFTVAESNEFKE